MFFYRLTVYSMYNSALSCGVSGGIIIAGLITIDHSWRYIYYVATALIGAATILVFFTMPETSFNRSPVSVPTDLNSTSKLYTETDSTEKSQQHITHAEAGARLVPKKHSYIQSLRLNNGVLTRESLLKMFFRPVALLILPPVLWATLVMSVTIGFLVAISSNFATAFATTYNFAAWQSGLCFISGLTGSLLGIGGGGWFSDKVANYLTKRNGGIREPEMRLPAIMLGLIASPLGLVLYGVGVNNKLHWICPTLGLGFRKLLLPPLYVGYWLIQDLGDSELRNRTSYECEPCLYHRRISPSSRRSNCLSACLQSLLRLSSVFLHKSLDCKVRLQPCFRRNGWYQRRDLGPVGSVLHLGQTHP